METALTPPSFMEKSRWEVTGSPLLENVLLVYDILILKLNLNIFSFTVYNIADFNTL